MLLNRRLLTRKSGNLSTIAMYDVARETEKASFSWVLDQCCNFKTYGNVVAQAESIIVMRRSNGDLCIRRMWIQDHPSLVFVASFRYKLFSSRDEFNPNKAKK